MHLDIDSGSNYNLGSMIYLRHLEGFYWVARTGGYSRAARAMPYPITQPAVHKQVKKLESLLGAVLFERVAKDRVQLTAAGRHLFQFIQPFFDELPGVVRALGAGTFGGELRVDAAGLVIRQLLPGWLKRLRTERPGIEVKLREIVGMADLERLRRGETDLVVDYLPRLANHVEARQVASIYPFIVLPKAHPKAGRKRLSLVDLRGEDFISYDPDKIQYALQMEALRHCRVEVRRVLSSSTAENILGFVAAGLGFSIVPWLDRKGPQAHGVIARLNREPAAVLPVYAAWRKGLVKNVLVESALACCNVVP